MENQESKPAELDPKQNVKDGIKAIEGLFHVITKRGSFPIDCGQTVMTGLNFLNQMHSTLLAQLTPEEIEAERKKQITPEVVQ